MLVYNNTRGETKTVSKVPSTGFFAIPTPLDCGVVLFLVK